LSSQAILDVQKASLSFGDRSIWKDLDLSVAPGEFIAVIGANASGKTVLLKAILGQLQLSSGAIDLLGKSVAHGSRQIGYIPQHRQADSGLPLRARDLLRMGLDGHRFGIPFPSSATNKKVAEMLEAVGAEDIANTPIGQLSGGQLQRIRVAQAVIDNPKLILADEPLSALDLKQQSLVAELINSQRQQNGGFYTLPTASSESERPMKFCALMFYRSFMAEVLMWFETRDVLQYLVHLITITTTMRSGCNGKTF
jgi:zinc/manganese transport system ATP-binding protein